MKFFTLVLIALLSSVYFVGFTSSINDCPLAGYCPWDDLDDDGDIDIFDIVDIAGRYGTSGEPLLGKAAIEYDSGWVDITDRAGEYFNITHNLNSTEVIVDIQGRMTIDGGIHQKHLGLTAYEPKWTRSYGGSTHDQGDFLVQTFDGGYVLAGSTLSYGAGDYDVWLVKTDACGNILWNNTYGGTGADVGRSLILTVDGGYALLGYTQSFGAGYNDVWLVKTDANGVAQWNRTYGGVGHDWAFSVVQTIDSGFVVAGYTGSFGAGNDDVWLVKTDASGNIEWDKTYGGANNDRCLSMVQANDGGYALSGYSNSFGVGNYDVWLVKTDASGNHQWNQTYGGTDDDMGFSMVQASDGGYAIAGYTGSFGAGSADFWLVKTDASGNHLWNQTYGGTDDEGGNFLIQTSDGGYVLVGDTRSFGAGSYDVWLVKTDSNGGAQWNRTYGGVDGDYGHFIMETENGGFVMTGTTVSFTAGLNDLWLVKTEIESGLAWVDSTADTITLYRGATDLHWNYVRVRIWGIKETP